MVSTKSYLNTTLALAALITTISASLILNTPHPITQQLNRTTTPQPQQQTTTSSQPPQNPCGAWDPTDRHTVTDWPIAGRDVSVTLSNNTRGSTVYLKAALSSDLATFVALRDAIYTSSNGDFCFARIRGVDGWVGRDAVLQVGRYVGNGVYEYQCAAIVFSNSTGAPAPSDCFRGAAVGRRFWRNETDMGLASTSTLTKTASSCTTTAEVDPALVTVTGTVIPVPPAPTTTTTESSNNAPVSVVASDARGLFDNLVNLSPIIILSALVLSL